MGIQTISAAGNQLTTQNKTFYDRTLLERLLPNLIWTKYGQKKGAPKHEGNTVNFRRFSSLAAATTPLTEGTTPAGSDLTDTAITATVAQYGDFVVVSDIVDVIGIDPVITEATEILGEQAGLTIDTIARDILAAGTTVQRVAGRAARINIVAGDVITGTEVRKAVRTLRKNKAKPISGNKYIALVGADVEFDLMGDTDWKDVSKYSAAEQIFDGEIGSLFGVKFIRCDNPKIFTGEGGGGIDVHAVVFFGKNAYGVVDIAGSAKPQTIVKPHGSSGTADPLNQRASVGWKCLFTVKILQDLAMLRFECAVTG